MVVNLFDEPTWPNGTHFTPLLDMVHDTIAPHMCQNQLIESYVCASVCGCPKNKHERGERISLVCATLYNRPAD